MDGMKEKLRRLALAYQALDPILLTPSFESYLVWFATVRRRRDDLVRALLRCDAASVALSRIEDAMSRMALVGGPNRIVIRAEAFQAIAQGGTVLGPIDRSTYTPHYRKHNKRGKFKRK